MSREYSLSDRMLMEFDRGLRSLFGRPPQTGRPHPATGVAEGDLSNDQRRESARLMRVNHCGEVCAQALYQGQAITARNPAVRNTMQEAADEENDHLVWCRDRLEQLDSRTSHLDPLFYLGALGLGTAAGLAGDRWSLGFLAETEHQVVKHLEGHLQRLPEEDSVSRAIVTQMRDDEARHAGTAEDQGAAALPTPVRLLMGVGGKLMTGTTRWI
ncbi:MAG: 2-polyprenyl-3-methyl-6-methoxy-1,4-benzoquinone monooxygenase [Ectothiorhodospiraceae bacterium]|nr:2-polyprenyl-3-methyl-6-methoxy-1,4-benzoquinone monooxygenase [Ectothiorhodospiraceae bacterium]MCH8504711.1 2-polyprenyl-3-methyl-6-methoxy-1,4-benzoquinone monooxygenase [Ectothiorhodospiraceae bacterium]